MSNYIVCYMDICCVPSTVTRQPLCSDQVLMYNPATGQRHRLFICHQSRLSSASHAGSETRAAEFNAPHATTAPRRQKCTCTYSSTICYTYIHKGPCSCQWRGNVYFVGCFSNEHADLVTFCANIMHYT